MVMQNSTVNFIFNVLYDYPLACEISTVRTLALNDVKRASWVTPVTNYVQGSIREIKVKISSSVMA